MPMNVNLEKIQKKYNARLKVRSSTARKSIQIMSNPRKLVSPRARLANATLRQLTKKRRDRYSLRPDNQRESGWV